MGTPSLSNRPFPFNFFSSPWPAQCLGSQVANAALGRRGLLRMLDYKPALGLGGKTAVFGPWPVQCLGSQAAVLVPSGHRSGPVYVATSVGAGRLPLADSTRGGSRDRRLMAAELAEGSEQAARVFIRAGNFFNPWPDGTSHGPGAQWAPGPVYVATSVGAGRPLLADSTRGGSRDRRFRPRTCSLPGAPPLEIRK